MLAKPSKPQQDGAATSQFFWNVWIEGFVYE